MTTASFLKFLILAAFAASARSFSVHRNEASSASSSFGLDRREFVRSLGFLAGAVVAAPAFAEGKLTNISNEKLAEYITKDVQDGQFMVTADISREIYDESATFQDEIDTYGMDQWIKGTKKLFVAENSHVDLVPNSLKVTDAEATFRFTENLQFRLPLPKRPTVYLSGEVVLARDPTTGLITSYREKWDQSISKVLTSANWS